MGWWITLGILAALAALPLGIQIAYDASGFLARAVLGPLRLTLYPRKPKKEKPKPSEQKAQPPKKQEEEALPKPPQPPAPEPKPKQKGGSLLDFLPFVRLGLDFLGDLRRKLRLDDLYLRLILGGGDPCDLAVNYGRTWAAVGNLLPQLERFFVIKKRDVEVECDFTASQTTVLARMEITITLGRLLTLAALYGLRGWKEYLNFQNKRKGGALQ